MGSGSYRRNIQFLKNATGKQDLNIGDQTEVEGQVFVKKLQFRNQEEIIKSFEWDIEEKEAEHSKIKDVNGIRLQAARILGSICEDEKELRFSLLLMMYWIVMSRSVVRYMLPLTK